MSPMLPVAVFGQHVPTGGIFVPAANDYPGTIRITMAAIDPTEAPQADSEGNVPNHSRSTLKIVKADAGADDYDEHEDYRRQSLIHASDDEDSDEPNGGPSDSTKAKKAKDTAALRRLLEAAKDSTNKGKGKAGDVVKMETDSDEEDLNGLDLEEFVVCTLDTDRTNQQPLDITIPKGETVFFVATGTHTIHLMGNYVILDSDNSDDDYDSDDDDYDLPPGIELADDSDEEDAEDELDGLKRAARIQEIDSDAESEDDEEAPKLVPAADGKKGKNKRPAEDETQVEGLDDMIAKANGKLSKKQLKKLKNNKGEAVVAENKVKDSPSNKGDKKVQFAKDLEQGPTGSAKDTADKKDGDNKAGSSVKVVQGVTIDDRKLGSGRTVKAGDKVGMRYIGKLTNGKVFDSNKKGEPFSCKVGKGEVIKGWDIGILGMAVGGERRLTIPAHLAYGSKAIPGIPANSTLIFDVKLLAIK